MNLKSYDRSDSEYNYLLSITNKTIPPNVFHKFFRYPAFLFSIWIIIGFFLQEYFNLSLLLIIVLFGLGFFGQDATPVVTEEDLAIMKAAKPDFIGFNYYNTATVAASDGTESLNPSADQQTARGEAGFYRGVDNPNLPKTEFG